MSNNGKSHISIGLSLINSVRSKEMIDDISMMIDKDPTSSFLIGDLRKNTSNESYYGFTSWYYKIEVEQTNDLEEAIKVFLCELSSKKNEILSVKQKYSMSASIDICIKASKVVFPSLFLNSDIIDFANYISAPIDIDCYLV